MEVASVLKEVDIFLDGCTEVVEAAVVARLQELVRVGFGEALILALEDFRKVAVADVPFAHGGDDSISCLVVGVRLTCTAVVDAGWAFVLPEPEVDLDDILDIDEVAALLAVIEAVRAAEEARFSRFLELTVELVEDRRHLALVLLLRAEDVEVAQTDDLAAALVHDLPYIAVEGELAVSVRIQCILRRIAFGKAVATCTVGRGGRSVEEGHAVQQAEVQQRLRVFVVDLHHVVDIVLHRIGAGALMEDGIDVAAAEFVVLDALQKVVLMTIVDEMKTAQVLVILAVLEVVDDEDVVPALAVEFLDDIAADKSGAAGDDDHEDPLSLFMQGACEMRPSNSCFFARQFPQFFLQLLAAHGVGAELPNDDARGEVGEEGGVRSLETAGKPCGEDGDDRVAGARYIEDFLCARRDMHFFAVAHERHAAFRARHEHVLDPVLAHDVVGCLNDFRIRILDGIDENLIDFLDIGRDVVRAAVLRPIRALGIDDDGHAVRVRRFDDRRRRKVAARSLRVVGNDDGVYTLGEFAAHEGEEFIDVDFLKRLRALEVKPHHLLMPADDAHLRRRRSIRRHESRVIDAVFHELFLERAAVVILADEAREKRVAAEECEVVRDVCRAAERFLLARDVVDRHGRFGRDARDFAVVVLVEHDVAGNEDLAAREAFLDEGEHFFDVHRQLPSKGIFSYNSTTLQRYCPSCAGI